MLKSASLSYNNPSRISKSLPHQATRNFPISFSSSFSPWRSQILAGIPTWENTWALLISIAALQWYFGGLGEQKWLLFVALIWKLGKKRYISVKEKNFSQDVVFHCAHWGEVVHYLPKKIFWAWLLIGLQSDKHWYKKIPLGETAALPLALFIAKRLIGKNCGRYS